MEKQPKPQLQKHKPKGGMLERIKKQLLEERQQQQMRSIAQRMLLEAGSLGKARRKQMALIRRDERRAARQARRLIRVEAGELLALVPKYLRDRAALRKRRASHLWEKHARKAQRAA